MPGSTILWLRHDLRLSDHAAFRAAVARTAPVVPVFVWSPEEEKPWPPGAASRWWLHQSLRSLTEAIQRRGSRLILRAGKSLQILEQLIDECGAEAVYWSRRCEPAVRRRDERIEQQLRRRGIDVRTFNAALLHEPWEVKTKQDSPYRVFTPFWRACQQQEIAAPLPAVRKLPAPQKWPRTEKLESLHLEPSIDWAGGLRKFWRPGEAGAKARLRKFLRRGLADYATQRDRPDVAGTSSLSPHLHFGEISPRQIVREVMKHVANEGPSVGKGAEAYLRELYWREFAHHLLWHFPHTTDEPLDDRFASFPWEHDPAGLRAWQRGQTGYPLVDAGLRQLWHIGWMHNRVRMIVASFLVKDLRLHWLAGAHWFWDTLVDADLANNTLGWQWTAGCGADAAPFFRVFNPTSQSKKFDADGNYTRRWVPELADLDSDDIHAPWEADEETLSAAGIRLGVNYPHPMVDHADARGAALAAFDTIKQ